MDEISTNGKLITREILDDVIAVVIFEAVIDSQHGIITISSVQHLEQTYIRISSKEVFLCLRRGPFIGHVFTKTCRCPTPPENFARSRELRSTDPRRR